mmetsp:Transcript_2843/g.4193  ORF Transcript_2843/g.4193 Transcript_2843/m.4193 type:complete len:205 (-) Transcript_2843:462-1076(-)
MGRFRKLARDTISGPPPHRRDSSLSSSVKSPSRCISAYRSSGLVLPAAELAWASSEEGPCCCCCCWRASPPAPLTSATRNWAAASARSLLPVHLLRPSLPQPQPFSWSASPAPCCWCWCWCWWCWWCWSSPRRRVFRSGGRWRVLVLMGTPQGVRMSRQYFSGVTPICTDASCSRFMVVMVSVPSSLSGRERSSVKKSTAHSLR